jgi:hypothetical protein
MDSNHNEMIRDCAINLMAGGYEMRPQNQLKCLKLIERVRHRLSELVPQKHTWLKHLHCPSASNVSPFGILCKICPY